MDASKSSHNPAKKSAEDIREFYDSVYHAEGAKHGVTSRRHYDRLATRLAVQESHRVLDVACGSGDWLESCARRGAIVTGIDISAPAIERCRRRLPDGDFKVQPAENLPFPNGSFDLVSCLGAVEHFVDPEKALGEMLRVAKTEARILLLVPNAGFLTRRLGLYRGTCQTEAKEEVRSLEEWRRMFQAAGFEVMSLWRDLHVLSWEWIACRGWFRIPIRLLQALMLPVWPLKWQYQVYFLCRRRN